MQLKVQELAQTQEKEKLDSQVHELQVCELFGLYIHHGFMISVYCRLSWVS